MVRANFNWMGCELRIFSEAVFICAALQSHEEKGKILTMFLFLKLVSFTNIEFSKFTSLTQNGIF